MNFDKDKFNWDGMYLPYEGEQGVYTTYYGENGERCHPTRFGLPKAAFIARFKYNRAWKSWVNFMVKNFTVEEYLGALERDESPLNIMMGKGYLEPHMRKQCRDAGYPATVEGWHEMVANITY